MRFGQGLLAFCVVISAACFLYAGSRLQGVTTSLFASPDETATMLFAHSWTFEEGFKLPHGLQEEISDLGSLHPRSMVRQGGSLVPVGFLGMPFLISLIERMFEGGGAYLTLILTLSAAYPLWRMVRRLNERLALLTVLVFLSFPTVLLYVNRGLFPNLPQLALVIWGIWALLEIERSTSKYQWLLAPFAGVVIGLALLMRPSEALWILPWCAWAIWMSRPKDSMYPFVTAGGIILLISLFGYVLGLMTYDFQQGYAPRIGYHLTDELVNGSSIVDRGSLIFDDPRSTIDLLPFGFHPRVVWENVRLFLFQYFGIWFGAALAGLILFLLSRPWKKDIVVFLGLIAWTSSVLLFIYGQSLYGDNIRGNISLGNSFLRYLLPLVPFISLGIALLLERLWSLKERGKVIGPVFTAFFIILGLLTAFYRDEEGLSQTRYELARYERIHQAALNEVPAGSIIISERSDKIFASGPYVAVSPMPSGETIDALLDASPGLYQFHRLFSDDELIMMPFIPTLIFEEGNEGLYQLKPPTFPVESVIQVEPVTN